MNKDCSADQRHNKYIISQVGCDGVILICEHSWLLTSDRLTLCGSHCCQTQLLVEDQPPPAADSRTNKTLFSVHWPVLSLTPYSSHSQYIYLSIFSLATLREHLYRRTCLRLLWSAELAQIDIWAADLVSPSAAVMLQQESQDELVTEVSL